MALKRILVPFAGYASDMRALRAALEMAKTQNAHVEVWHVSQDSLVEFAAQDICREPFIDRAACESALSMIKSAETRHSGAIEKVVEKAFRFMGVKRAQGGCTGHASASFNTATGNVPRLIAERGRQCDLIVMCPGNDPRFSQVLLEQLFATERPLLLIPRRKGVSINDRILIAWNGSPEAARAVNLAMPMLEKGKVWIMTADGATVQKTSSNELMACLQQHKVDVEAMPIDVKAASVPESILEAAKLVDAGLIVMGAYGHSRAREMIFGGVTDFILKKTDVPVLMTH
jgi:nucleotide-binding universal stress UspA family protein